MSNHSSRRRRRVPAPSAAVTLLVNDACLICEGHAVVFAKERRVDFHHDPGCPVADHPDQFEPDLSDHLSGRLFESTGGHCLDCWLDASSEPGTRRCPA